MNTICYYNVISIVGTKSTIWSKSGTNKTLNRRAIYFNVNNICLYFFIITYFLILQSTRCRYVTKLRSHATLKGKFTYFNPKTSQKLRDAIGDIERGFTIYKLFCVSLLNLI